MRRLVGYGHAVMMVRPSSNVMLTLTLTLPLTLTLTR